MLRPEILVFMIPIVAIVMGIASSMLKTHYQHKERMGGGTPETGTHRAELDQMSRIADILDQRVKVLERILDDEIPNWRDQA
jgi:phage shock protein B